MTSPTATVVSCPECKDTGWIRTTDQYGKEFECSCPECFGPHIDCPDCGRPTDSMVRDWCGQDPCPLRGK